MRLLHLHIITEYKNLKDFKIDFDGASFIDVFVGKNGTGKSNLFEALIEIFRHLYEIDYPIIFDYFIVYKLKEETISIKWENGKLELNSSEIKTVNKKSLPDNILIYYSGHNNKITSLIDEYEAAFKGKIKSAKIDDNREFIGIGKDYKSILLAVLLLQKENKATSYILKKLGIGRISNEFKIVLKRPFYAINNTAFDVDQFIPETAFWRADGIVGDFLKELNTLKAGDARDIKSGNAITIERDSGFFARIKNEDEYILYFNIEDFQEKFKTTTTQELFRMFDNLKLIEMLKDISIEILLDNGTVANINNFSDGQFQTVYIYSIVELFKEMDCLTLLDEPDAFLHPEWQFDFLKQVVEIADNGNPQNHILMSSHSASTISRNSENDLNLFELNGNTITIKKMPKSDVIKSLSAGLITFTESEAKLNINHFLNNTSKAVLFTEGITDEMIIETAWKKLYPNQKPNFEIQNAYSCAFLRNTLKEEDLYKRFPNKIFFSIFDFDEAYNDWKQLGTEIRVDPALCLTRKLKIFESYSMLLPVTNPNISNQVLNHNTGGTFLHRSLLTIELMFYGVPGIENYFVVDNERTDGFIKFISDGQKVPFAENVVPNLDAQYFQVFKPIFDFIISKTTV